MAKKVVSNKTRIQQIKLAHNDNKINRVYAYLCIRLIRSNNNTYASSLLKNTAYSDLHKWIIDNNTSSSPRIQDKIYSALYKHSLVCQYGNQLHLIGINDAQLACTPECNCVKDRRKTASELVDKQAASAKGKATMLQKYGVISNGQKDEVREKMKQNKLAEDIRVKIEDYDYMHNEFIVKGKTITELSKELDVTFTTMKRRLTKLNLI